MTGAWGAGPLLADKSAWVRAVSVLHHDRHYDRLAEVLPFTSVWIVPPPMPGTA